MIVALLVLPVSLLHSFSKLCGADHLCLFPPRARTFLASSGQAAWFVPAASGQQKVGAPAVSSTLFFAPAEDEWLQQYSRLHLTLDPSAHFVACRSTRKTPSPTVCARASETETCSFPRNWKLVSGSAVVHTCKQFLPHS